MSITRLRPAVSPPPHPPRKEAGYREVEASSLRMLRHPALFLLPCCAPAQVKHLLLQIDLSCAAVPAASINLLFIVGAPPVMLRDPLGFCGYTGISCCDAVNDAALREEFEDMSISDAACAAIVKAFLCARCIPSPSAVLFNTADLTTTTNLCAATPSPWSSSAAHHRLTASTRSTQEQDTTCLERISAGSYLNMAAHPDGSGRVFLSSRDGKIWLASMPKRGSGAILRVHRPFLDLTHRVLGLLGVAFHPEFATNGRFFVSYSCDSSASPPCGAGRCWCAAAGNGSRPCRYQLVVAEFSAKGGADYSKEKAEGQQQYERVYLISNKAGSQSATLSKAAVSLVINHGRPAEGRMPSIVGGLVYRGSADPSLEGRKVLFP
ncbi:HIPL1 protein-like [Phragmites australis]|uniref:HIPL1 protein-like n=1 Tax=Phragmites australis TaxID=29695 RepID=UPI002D768E6C|nr:HIPL1 protein-like [Phragmites australis]